MLSKRRLVASSIHSSSPTDEQAVVLDLRVPMLRIERINDAVSRVDAQPVAHGRFRVCTEDDEPIPNLRYAMAVPTDRGEGWLVLDTGARVTSITAQSPLVRLTSNTGRRDDGLARKPQGYSVARNLEISFADSRAIVDAQVVVGLRSGCGPDGIFGRDALAGCALVLGRHLLAVACE